MAKRANKFGAKKITVDGIKFDSVAESDRYFTLANMQRAGEITGLSPHPEFSMVVMGKLIGHYTADASYFRKSDRKLVAEDTKSEITREEPDYRLRIQLCRALYPNVLFEEFVAGSDNKKEWKAVAKKRAKTPWIQRRGLKRPRTTAGGHPG